MKLGIIGMTRSGKTTIFNALTRRQGEAPAVGGQPSPVLGVVAVPDPRVDWLSGLYQPKKTTHAQVTYLDLQGMPGLAEQKKEYMALLLNHMRPVDALLVVVRNFPHAGLPAPRPDQEFRGLMEEFLIADLATVEKRLERIAADRGKGRKTTAREPELLERCALLLNQEQSLRDEPELALAPELRGFTFLSAKPLLLVVNNPDDHDRLPDAAFPGTEALVVRGQLEMELAQLSDEEAAGFLADYGIREAAVNRVIELSYRLLNLATFLTVGGDEVKAWTIPAGISAVEAAGVIHSDIQRGFIRAEVVAYEDLKRAGDYNTARKEAKVRLEGKTYPVRDGDVIQFRFNV
ncbi:MAG: hypothetical protein AUK55_04760 [Syntrophobacteraceae bacterium CG2_30_61_12]|nr:MAG: hypothetical protein AUK55_04760 [Syntrophobacteraceae bacterium CG2_30_61_12]PIU32201.1 MAG: redox-regulated ATPase YchF [Syntrophobacteraceae bacterium CG07_land_8_20_14_0_80_61_8]